MVRLRTMDVTDIFGSSPSPGHGARRVTS